MQPSILIFGTGPGIGAAIARRFGGEGFAVGLVARSADSLRLLREDLASCGITSAGLAGNVADPNGVRRVMDEHNRQFGLPDIVVYNASRAEVEDVLRLKWSTVRELNEVNIGGALHVAQSVLPDFLARGSGRLFLTGGGQALHPHPDWAALSIGKAGMRNLALALAKRVEGTTVHVATITVCGYVQDQDPKYNAAAIADLYWDLYLEEPPARRTEIIY